MFQTDRRSLLAGAGAGAVALACSSTVPLQAADARWQSPVVRQSDLRLAVIFPDGRIAWELRRLDHDDAGLDVRTVEEAENYLLSLYATTQIMPSHNLSVWLQKASNRVACMSRRGPGNTWFSSTATWRRLGLVPSGEPMIGRWQRYEGDAHHPLMQLPPQSKLYGTDTETPIGKDIISFYVGEADYDGPAMIHSTGTRRRLILQPRWDAYGVRSSFSEAIA